VASPADHRSKRRIGYRDQRAINEKLRDKEKLNIIEVPGRLRSENRLGEWTNQIERGGNLGKLSEKDKAPV